MLPLATCCVWHNIFYLNSPNTTWTIEIDKHSLRIDTKPPYISVVDKMLSTKEGKMKVWLALLEELLLSSSSSKKKKNR